MISQKLDKIDEKQLYVPAFQREYVRKRDDSEQFVESLIKEYPIGIMLTWGINAPSEMKEPHKYHEKQGAVCILLNGQQRLAAVTRRFSEGEFLGQFPRILPYPYHSLLALGHAPSLARRSKDRFHQSEAACRYLRRSNPPAIETAFGYSPFFALSRQGCCVTPHKLPQYVG